MSETVEAVVMTGPGRPLERRRFAAPRARPGGAILEMVATEVCGTDVHLHHGRLSGVPYPIIPGHVNCGRVLETGGSLQDVEGRAIAPGALVTFFDVFGTCGNCWHCLVAKAATRCPHRRVYGITTSAADGLLGGWAERIEILPGVKVLPLTEGVEAEDFMGGYSSAVLYPKQSGAGYVPNWSLPPGDINPPIIFEPPAALLEGGLEVWVALSGGQNWGGAQVWLSTDGDSYALVGSVSSPATQGTLTSELPPHASPDTINALSVDLTLSQGQLGSVSPTDAANLVTLCYAGGELLSYQSATLTGLHQYELTTLYRGAYGSAITDHPARAPFVRLDGSVGRFPYPSSLIGQTVYLKFASLNIVGGGLQGLASVPAFPYTIRGTGQASSTLVSGSYIGTPTANLVLQSYVFAAPVTFPTGFSGSRGTAGSAASAASTFSIQKNGTIVGTMTFAASAAMAMFTMSTATIFTAGDVLTVVAPATADATLANLAWTFTGFAQ